MLSEPKYTTLIFDLGGVLLNIDYQRTKKAFENLGVNNFDSHYTQFNQNKLFDRFERGEISKKKFRAKLINKTGIELSKTDFDSAWNAMLLDFPEERMTWLENLGKTHQLILLSNTNEIHIKAFEKTLKDTGLLHRFSKVFYRKYYSSRLGLRKPESDLFGLLIKTHGLDPAKTLFIDDSPQHIEGAQKLGLQTFFLEKGMEVSAALNGLL